MLVERSHEIACVVCDRPTSFHELTTTDPECPGMFAQASGDQAVYFGVVREEEGSTRLVVCCAGECIQAFLRASRD